jgi:hypothetical protein
VFSLLLFIYLFIYLLVCNYYFIYLFMFVCLMVFNATFNNISVISWWSVLLWRNPEDLAVLIYYLVIPMETHFTYDIAWERGRCWYESIFSAFQIYDLVVNCPLQFWFCLPLPFHWYILARSSLHIDTLKWTIYNQIINLKSW